MVSLDFNSVSSSDNLVSGVGVDGTEEGFSRLARDAGGVLD